MAANRLSYLGISGSAGGTAPEVAMRSRYARKARRRSRSIRLSGFEPLESRALLAGDRDEVVGIWTGTVRPEGPNPGEGKGRVQPLRGSLATPGVTWTGIS